MSGFGKNIASIRAQRLLHAASDGVGKASERLSSGLRINRASDDAAGLAVSSTLNSKSRVYSAAVRNANDGLSALSIADSAAGELTTILGRLKELAESASNGTFSLDQRKSIDTEAKALTDEYNRIVGSVDFNGNKLFNGSITDLRIQLGFGATDTLGINLTGGLQQNAATGDVTASTQFMSFFGTAESAVADFNNDGRVDVALADNLNVSSGKVYVMGATATGVFKTASATLTEASTVVGVTAGDFDNDGRADVIAANAARLTLFRGNGNLTFQGGSRTYTTASMNALASGDVNGDGNLDLVTTEGSTLKTYLGAGNGTFAAAQATSVGSTYTTIRFADIDADNKKDLILANSSGFARLSGSGTGTFSVASTTSISNAGFDIGDVNRDGIDDVVASSGADLALYLGNRNGTSQSAQTITMGGNIISDAALSDLDNDGHLDLIASDGAGADVTIVARLSNGDGTFGAAIINETSETDSAVLSVGDFNGDGANDVALHSQGSRTFRSFISSTVATTDLTRVNLTTRDDALAAIATLNTALDRVTKERGIIGAAQSRLVSALNTVSSSRENYTAAASRITDADIADESAELIKKQILQRSAANVLAQANLLPERALSLLRA